MRAKVQRGRQSEEARQNRQNARDWKKKMTKSQEKRAAEWLDRFMFTLGEMELQLERENSKKVEVLTQTDPIFTIEQERGAQPESNLAFLCLGHI